MKSTPIRTLFISLIVSAMLLPLFAFFVVLPVNAQIQPPELNTQELLEFFPEIKRLNQELDQAKPNEEISGKARPQFDEKCRWYEFKCVIENAIVDFFDGIVSFVIAVPLLVSEYFFDWLVVVNLNGAMYESGFVRAGWSISRDIANMFFIFFVLWMALATIFQFENYSAKRLLPKLIVVALLVNFSLPIGLFVIRTSNAIGKTFYLAATGGNSLANQIVSMARMKSTKQAAEFSKDNLSASGAELDVENCAAEIKTGGVFQQAIDSPDPSSAAANITSVYDKCGRSSIAEGLTSSNGGIFFYGMIAVFWKLIIGLVASFVFLAGAIFLLVRYLSLVTLLIFGPLAFLFMILPATQEHWNKWWTKLTQWSFFMPAFMFMIMLATRLSNQLLVYQIADAQAGSKNIASLGFQYMLTMGLFILSLFVAQSMGIAMSGTVVGWGRSMARGAGRYAKGKGIQYAKIGAGGVAGGIQGNATLQRTLNRIPLVGATLGGALARGLGKTQAMGEAAEKQRQRQKFGFAEKLSDEGRANYIASERAGAARDMLTKMDEGDRRRTVNALSTQGQIELAQKLRSVQSEALVGNATNNPEVYARLSGEAGPLDSKDYPAKVAKIAHDKFKAENLASDFLRGATGREYLKTATEDELKAIAKTRQGAEALGGTLAEIARTIGEQVTDARADMQQRAVPYDLKQLTQTISSQHLSPQTQQYLNTAPGMYEGRMAIRTRRGGENDQEDEDEQFLRRIRKASQRGLFQQPEN